MRAIAREREKEKNDAANDSDGDGDGDDDEFCHLCGQKSLGLSVGCATVGLGGRIKWRKIPLAYLSADWRAV